MSKFPEEEGNETPSKVNEDEYSSKDEVPNIESDDQISPEDVYAIDECKTDSSSSTSVTDEVSETDEETAQVRKRRKITSVLETEDIEKEETSYSERSSDENSQLTFNVNVYDHIKMSKYTEEEGNKTASKVNKDKYSSTDEDPNIESDEQISPEESTFDSSTSTSVKDEVSETEEEKNQVRKKRKISSVFETEDIEKEETSYSERSSNGNSQGHTKMSKLPEEEGNETASKVNKDEYSSKDKDPNIGSDDQISPEECKFDSSSSTSVKDETDEETNQAKKVLDPPAATSSSSSERPKRGQEYLAGTSSSTLKRRSTLNKSPTSSSSTKPKLRRGPFSFDQQKRKWDTCLKKELLDTGKGLEKQIQESKKPNSKNQASTSSSDFKFVPAKNIVIPVEESESSDSNPEPPKNS